MAKMPSVLITDDDPDARKLLRCILKTLECEKIKETSTGEEAVEVYKTFRPQVVFLDINLKPNHQSGLHTSKIITRENQNTFVVMMSADSTVENILRSKGSGAKEFMAKPYTMGMVEKVLLEYKEYKAQNN